LRPVLCGVPCGCVASLRFSSCAVLDPRTLFPASLGRGSNGRLLTLWVTLSPDPSVSSKVEDSDFLNATPHFFSPPPSCRRRRVSQPFARSPSPFSEVVSPASSPLRSSNLGLRRASPFFFYPPLHFSAFEIMLLPAYSPTFSSSTFLIVVLCSQFLVPFIVSFSIPPC